MARFTLAQALAFIDEHGIVMVSADGPAPRLADAIAGEPVSGSWWGHPQGKLIFTILGQVAGSDQVLRCRLAGGKLTLVHRRLWPALVRIAHRFTPGQLARVHEEHSANGRHVATETAFPHWVPPDAMAAGALASEADALAAFAPFLPKTRN